MPNRRIAYDPNTGLPYNPPQPDSVRMFNTDSIVNVLKLGQTSTHILALVNMQLSGGLSLQLIRISKSTFQIDLSVVLGAGVGSLAPSVDLVVTSSSTYTYVVMRSEIRVYRISDFALTGSVAMPDAADKAIGYAILVPTRLYVFYISGYSYIAVFNISNEAAPQLVTSTKFDYLGWGAACVVPISGELRVSTTQSGANYIVRYTADGAELGKTRVDLRYTYLVAAAKSDDMYGAIVPDSSIYRISNVDLNSTSQAIPGTLDPSGTVFAEFLFMSSAKNLIYAIGTGTWGFLRYSTEPKFVSGSFFAPMPVRLFYVYDDVQQKLYAIGNGKAPGATQIALLSIDVKINTDVILDLSAEVLETPNSIKLSWTNITGGETSTYIYRAPAGGSFVQIASVAPGVSSYIDSTIENEVEYQYYVVETDGAKYGSQSNIVTVTGIWKSEVPGSTTSRNSRIKYDPLGTSSGSRYTLEDSNKVTLYWSYRTLDNCGDVVNRIEGFKIYRSSGGLFELVATVSADITSWQDTIANLALSYRYYIVPFNSQRDGVSSSIYNIDLSPLRVPNSTALTLESYSGSSAQLKWSYISGCSGYKIYRRNKSTNSPWRFFSTIAGASNVAYVDGAIPLRTSSVRLFELEYKVVPYNSFGDGAASNIVTVPKIGE